MFNKEVGMNKTTPISRRGILAAAAVAAVIPLVAGCTAGGDGGGSTSSEETTITVMAGAQDLPTELIADFEAKNPNIKVNHILTDPARLNTMLAAGNPPDIAPGGAVGSANINARGLATDLTPFLDKSTVLKEDDLQPVNDSFRWDGKQSGKGPLYGIVKDWSQDNTLWYNTALFDKAGVPQLSETEPVTYDELLQTAKKLTVKEGNTNSVHGLGLEWGWSLYGPMSCNRADTCTTMT
jgi:multiple sugar transport system substrate-binding protein